MLLSGRSLAEATARLIEEIGASTGAAYDQVVEMLGKLDVAVGRPSRRVGG